MTRARLSFAEQLPVTEVKAIFVFTAAQGEAGGRRALPGWTGHLKNQPSVTPAAPPPASHTWVQTTARGGKRGRAFNRVVTVHLLTYHVRYAHTTLLY